MPLAALVRRVVATVLVMLVVASAVVGVVALGAMRRTLPRTDGSLVLRGLAASVEVRRDAQGVPNVYADSPEDLFMAQGYVSAQDRFFEMDLRRHVASGRLTELVGEEGLASDRVVRTLGWRGVAAAELPRLAADTRRNLQAYADGVNAYLAQESSPGTVALEYLALGLHHPGYTIERWDAVDSLAWLKAAAWDLDGGADAELARAQLLASGHTLADVRALYPTGTDAAVTPVVAPGGPARPASVTPTTMPSAVITGTSAAPVGGAAAAASAPTGEGATPGESAALARTRDALGAVRHLVGRGDGSSAWAVAGSRTSTGTPLLANAPSLMLSQPGVWHQVGLHCRTLSATCPYDVSGFALAGLPGVVVGRTAGVAWGVTSLDADTRDLFVERIAGAQVQHGATSEPVTTRTETLKVAGGEDVTLVVRSTRHGPVVSDLPAASDGPAVALAWTGSVPGRSADALFALDRAQSGAQLRAAAELLAAPALGLVWADTAGHVGYQAAGLVPVRASATSGTPPGWLPAPGWDAGSDWQGFVPYPAMPHVVDPAAGYVVAADQPVTSATTPFLAADRPPGRRAERIRALLESSPALTPAAMRAIQSDTTSVFEQRLAQALLRVPVTDAFVREGQDTLRGWGGTTATGQGGDSRATAYVHAVWSEVVRLMLEPRVGANTELGSGASGAALVDAVLDDPRNALWDDPRTPAIETRDSVLLTAMTAARADLTRRQGKDPDRWDWGAVHTVTLRHALGSGFPGLWRSAVDRGPYPAPGDALSVGALRADPAGDPAEPTHGPSLRVVVDLARADASTWVNQSGVSAHPYDDHYDDQIDAWLSNEPFAWAFTPAAVRAATSATMTLEPDRSGN